MLRQGFPHNTGVVNIGRGCALPPLFGGGGAPQSLMGSLIKSKHGGAWGELKLLSKNIPVRSLIVKLVPAISLQASKFTKNELLHTYFSRISARF